MTPLPDVVGLIAHAATTPRLRMRARNRLAELITAGDLLAYQGREHDVRPSDSGACALALWAEIHGHNDLPRHGIDDHLTRLDLGALIGAWEGCLFWAGAHDERNASPWHVVLEYEPQAGGHIDALCAHKETNEYVPVEFKSSYSTGVIKPPDAENIGHLLQATEYAERVGATRMILVLVRPPGKPGERIKQFAYEVAPFASLAAQERVRLRQALAVEPPLADPQFAWSCFTCRYSACPRNVNKMIDSPDAMFA